MVIKFTCPNGHSLSCSEKQAGKSAKCPKCGTHLSVPNSNDEVQSAEMATEITDSVNHRELEPDDAQATDDIIVFLCPNGHKLNGPSRLAGQPGQCPHCGERFRIPSHDDVEDEEDELDEFAVEEVPVGTVVEEFDEQLAEFPAMDDENDIPLAEPVEEMLLDGLVAHTATNGHSLVDVFSKLWQEKGDNGVVELYLEQGERILAEHFSARLSQHGHGVFAVRDDDGSYTVTTVPWNSITRIGFRNVKALPENLFD